MIRRRWQAVGVSLLTGSFYPLPGLFYTRRGAQACCDRINKWNPIITYHVERVED